MSLQKERILRRYYSDQKWVRVVSEIGSGYGRENITVLACGLAVGERLPPYVAYKAKALDEAWCANGAENARYTVNGSEWMDHAQFTVVY